MPAVSSFATARLPRIQFGAGTAASLPAELRAFGSRALIVTGARSFRESPAWAAFAAGCREAGVSFETVAVGGEPSPDLVDSAVAEFRGAGIEVVAAIGGGSALDAGKAIAGLLVPGNSVMDHLEGVGRGVPYAGPALPFIAAPTTAGTGSEATKNAVLSRRGADGFKKSFRDDSLVARVAVVDPDFLISCPAPQMAANGMDAFTQLLESFTSTRAGAMTDALAWSGMEAFAEGFFAAFDGAGNGDEGAAAGRTGAAYASLMSGITLAQTGLGVVHGLASPLGAAFPAPHGAVCGTLLAVATEVNIRALKARNPDSSALPKYARVGRLLAGDEGLSDDAAREALVRILDEWTERLSMPRLGEFGMGGGDVGAMVAASGGNSMKTNPLVLADDEIAEIVERRL